MLQLGIQLMWLILYQYYIEQICDLEKGFRKRIVVWGLTGVALLAAGTVVMEGPVSRGASVVMDLQTDGAARAWLLPGAWLLTVLIMFLYVLFYDGEPLGRQWWKVLLPGTALTLASLAERPVSIVLLNGGIMLLFLGILAYAKGYFRIWSALLNIAVYGIMCLYLWNNREAADTGLLFFLLALEFLLFLSLEGTLSFWHRGFENSAELFQREILSHQYEEVKEIYLNMRGWRHDYHNHLQVMKAQISSGQVEEMKAYLDKLEENLEKVDTYVKSGNLMADAILNSKLSLAEQKGVCVNCKAILPEVLSVEDVDLCVLLGNLLDNALEACEKIPEEQRFLRIYMTVNKSQLYLSIQNSAREELDFNERNYISTKRGSHGLGMKRVKALTDKYEGFLTLANEPGIFAAEVTLPL